MAGFLPPRVFVCVLLTLLLFLFFIYRLHKILKLNLIYKEKIKFLKIHQTLKVLKFVVFNLHNAFII